MYEQRRREVNKEFEKYQKQLKAAKKSGSKAAADKVRGVQLARCQAARQQRTDFGCDAPPWLLIGPW